MTRSSAKTIQQLPYRSFELLRDLVHEHTGLYFEDGKIDLFLDKLSPLIGEPALDSLLDYYYLLKYDSGPMYEWGKLFDALTVQESFFWREMEQIRTLVDEIVPQYFKTHPNQPLNIWSAACAGGCEPLTIAMALNEAGWFERATIHIDASNASPRAIDAARRGVYREHNFRRLPPDLRKRYFVSAGGTGSPGDCDHLSRVSEELHSRVQWRVANLMSETDIMLASTASHVIFCRNVFIYFSDFAAQKTVQTFSERMPRPGYLFVGMAESLMNIKSDFELHELGDAFVHIKSC